MLKSLLSTTNLVTRTIAQFTIVAVAGTVGVTVASTSASASLDAIATNSTAQTISSGTLALTIGANTGSTGFGSTVSSMAPGDTYSFALALVNGTMAGQNLYLSIVDTATAATLLTTSATKSLVVAVSECSVAWTMPAGTCSGTTTPTLITATALSTMSPSATPTGAEQTMSNSSFTASATRYFKFTLTLPSSITETTTNGTPPSGTIQGLSASINWKIRETQRTATNTAG